MDGKEILDSDNTSLVLTAVLNKINNEFQYKCLDEMLRLLNADWICQSTHGCVLGHTHSIPGLPGTMFLVHQFVQDGLL